ncbi:MAG TPA: hypothetical protein VE999_10205 [Gemmataceae bacterium]|nr:hypothetical protein [Gemmataceae bacterium]
MTLPDWDQLTWYHYLGIGGGVVVILALLMYFTRASQIKVPAIFMGILGGLGVGVAVGAGVTIVANSYAVKMEQERANEGADTSVPPRANPRMGGKGGGRPGMGGGGPRGPSSKAQLGTLLAKLDLLTSHPLSVTLDPEQKKKVNDIVQRMDKEEVQGEDQAKAKLEELRNILTEEQRKTLEAAGFRWPGQGQGGGGRGGRGGATLAPPNPDIKGKITII